MYDIKFLDNEKIALISDNTLVYTNGSDKLCTSIITNIRYLILDYPSNFHNSLEDLRASGKITYLKQKEVIFSIDISDITKITKDNNYDKILLNNQEYILVKDDEIINYLKHNM